MASPGLAHNPPVRRGPHPILLVLGALFVLLSSYSLARSGGGYAVVGGMVGVIGLVAVVRRPAIGVLVYLTTFLFTYPAFLRGVGNFTINNVLGLILLPMMLFGMLRDGNWWIAKMRPMWLLGGIVAVMVTSGIFYTPATEVGNARQTAKIERSQRSQGPALVSTRAAGAKFFTRFVFLTFFVFFIRTPKDLKWVVAAIIGCLMMTYLSLSAEAGPFGWGTGRLRVMGESGLGMYAGRNPNKLAYFALFCLTLLWYARRGLKRPVMYPIWGLVTAITFMIIPLTGSRSGLLNLLMFIAIVLFEGEFNYRKVVGLVVVTTAIVVQMGFNVSVVDVFFPEDVAERLTRFDVRAEALETGVTARGSAEGRLLTARAALRIFSYHPLFGVGIGNFNTERAVTDPTGVVGPPHNSYLWALSEGGMIVFCMFMAFFWWMWKSLRAIEWEYEARFGAVDMLWLVQAMRTGLIGFLLFSIFADMWHHVMFYIVMGLGISTIRLHQVYAETGKVPAPFTFGRRVEPVVIESNPRVPTARPVRTNRPAPR